MFLPLRYTIFCYKQIARGGDEQLATFFMATRISIRIIISIAIFIMVIMMVCMVVRYGNGKYHPLGISNMVILIIAITVILLLIIIIVIIIIMVMIFVIIIMHLCGGGELWYYRPFG